LAGFGEHAVWVEFTSGRFDHSSELPADANAGNRFYGRDVAEFIAAGLGERGFDTSFIDEDWGWQVHAARPDGSVFEVSIYHNPDEDPTRPDDWALMLRSLRKERALGLFSRFREVPVKAAETAALSELFEQISAPLRQTQR
jgi:hypothetical protein